MAELLKLLTPKSTPTEIGGGVPEITPEMVAGALAKLPDYKSRYARYKWCEVEENRKDGEKQKIVFDIMFGIALPRALNEGWKTPAGGLRRLSSLALYESTRTDRCQTCNGAGFTIEGKVKPCGGCGGSGRTKISNNKRAEKLKTDISGYKRWWRTKYETVYGELLLWDYDIARMVYKHVRG